MVLIRDQYYTRDNSEIGIYAVEDEVVLYPGSALYRGQ